MKLKKGLYSGSCRMKMSGMYGDTPAESLDDRDGRAMHAWMSHAWVA